MPAYLKQPTQSLQIRRTDSEDAAVRPAAAPERHAAPSVPTGDRRRAFRHSVRLRIFRSGNFAVSAPLFPKPRRREVTACGGTFPDIATSVIGIAPVSGSASPHDRPRTVAHGLMHPRSGTFVYFLTDIFSPAQGRRPCTAPGPTNTASNLHPARRKHRLTPLFSHLVRKQFQPCTRPDENTGFAPIVHIDRSPNSFCSAPGRTQTPASPLLFTSTGARTAFALPPVGRKRRPAPLFSHLARSLNCPGPVTGSSKTSKKDRHAPVRGMSVR